MTTIDDEDEDDIPEPRRTRDAIARLIQIAASPGADLSAFRPTVADVIRSMGQRIRSKDAWEAVRAILARLLMQGMTNAEIALELGITPERAERWKTRYHQDLRREAATMQPRDFIMESLAAHQAIRAEAWKGQCLAETPKERREWAKLALDAENQIMRLGAAIGLYGERGDKPLDGAAYGEARQDPGAAAAARIKIMLECFLDPRTTTEDMDRRLSDGGLLTEDTSGSYDDLFTGLTDERPDAELITSEEMPPAPPVFNVRRRRRPV